MLLEEAGWFGRLPIEVHASDASPSAVSRAHALRCTRARVRILPQPMKENLDQLDGGWRPIPSLQSRITSWSVVNLLDPCQVAPFVCAPVIFCRNAFIYFAPGAIRKVIEAFAQGCPRRRTCAWAHPNPC